MIIEAAAGQSSELTSNSFEIVIPLFNTTTHSAASPGSLRVIGLSSPPTVIVPGDYFGCHVLPLEFDVSNDAIHKIIQGFYFESNGIQSETAFRSGEGALPSYSSIEMRVGYVNEDFNSGTVTFADTLTWLTNFVETGSHKFETYTDGNSRIDFEIYAKNGGTNRLIGFTNLDFESDDFGVLGAEID
jgi:hypothetical protein